MFSNENIFFEDMEAHKSRGFNVNKKGVDFMIFQMLKVGEVYPQYIGVPDGIKCNINDGGVRICITMPHPSENELKQLSSNADIQFKVLKMRGFIFLLAKFGSLQWMDAPYNAYLTANLTQLPYFKDGTGYSTTIEVYDTLSGQLCSLRHTVLPTEMSRQLVSYIKEQLQEPLDRNTLGIQLSQIYNAYSTKELVKFAPKSYYIRH